jgi:predicted O-methyltransferase YrrM
MEALVNLRTIGRNALRPGFTIEMVRKIFLRTRYGFKETESAQKWARERAVPLEVWANERNPELWLEAKEFSNSLRDRAIKVLQPLEDKGIDMGGGGSVELLYFLVRWRKPNHVLETGVAAGWSSCAILTALEKNNQGHLSSSDFPYFRIEDPEKYIGILVPEGLKHRWTLMTLGDRRNIPKLVKANEPLDLVHYDSDKSRPSRDWFAAEITSFLSDDAVLVWDDIQDNLAFHDRSVDRQDCSVLDTPNGIVGLEEGKK